MTSNGRLTLQGGKYRLDTEPHVRMTVRRLFLSAYVQGNAIIVGRTPENTETMRWILDRWPHDVCPDLMAAMDLRVEANQSERAAAAAILSGVDVPGPPARWNPAFPLRPYQNQAVALTAVKKSLLLGDDLGLGKTATAIGVIVANPGPALVVCYRHLQRQWAAQIAQFCPGLRTHVIREMAEYAVAPHDVTITTYSKLHAIAPRQAQFGWKTVIYDEVQELRGSNTGKGSAARELAVATNIRMGLSATPVYNYAGEIYNVMEAIAPGALGDWHEFSQEWGVSDEKKMKVKDPEALGSWMRSQGIFLRRHRRDVGRELPPVHKSVQMVDHDGKVIDRLKAQFNELAVKVLQGSFTEKGLAARRLDSALRHATGVAKAPGVADVVEQLAANGEQILLLGWHREVYEIWGREFDRMGITYAMFTGSESTSVKSASVQAVLTGQAQVLIMSLRAGAGLDGLQRHIRTAVVGELDWSPQVIEQCIGRLNRDGQEGNVSVITCMSEGGADPIIAGILGAKWEQSTSITDPSLVRASTSGLDPSCPDNRVTELAKQWLQRKK